MLSKSFFRQLGRLIAILVLSPLIVAAVSFARWDLADILGEKAPYALYIFGVILASQLLGFSAGLFTTVLSAAAGTLLFLSDKNGVVDLANVDLFRIALFIAEGLAISVSAELLRSSRLRSTRREEDLRIVTDHMPAVIAYIDKNENYRFANRGFLDSFDVDPASVIGKSSREFLTETDYAKVKTYIQQALRGERVEYETDLVLKAGKSIRIKSSYIPDIDSKGKVRGYFALVVDITERYRSELAAKTAEREFNAVLNHSSMVYIALDADGVLTRLEGHGLKSIALEPATSLGCPYAEVFAENAAFLSSVRRAYAGESFSEETRLRERVFASHFVPSPDASGAVTSVFVIGSDITEIKQAQFDKQKISERLQLALESNQLGTWELNIPTGEVLWDSRSRVLFGVPEDQKLTRDVFVDRLHPEDRDRVLAEDARALRPENGRVQTEFRVIDGQTGQVRWLASQGKVRFDESGKAILLTGTLLDITQRRFAENELRLSQERLTLALESAKMGSWHWDIDTGALSTSSRVTEMSGADLGTDFFEAMERAIHPEDREDVKEKLARALATDGRFGAEYRVVKPDGSIAWTLSRGQASFDSNGRPLSMTGLLLDTTDQKLSESALIRARDEAERASQMKSAFLANMSHEIRTPLGAMLGFASFLKDPGLPETERDRYIDVLTRNGEQLVYLIDDILDFSKVAAGHLQFEILPTKPAQIVEDVVSLLRVKAEEKGLTLAYRIEDSMPSLIGTDPTRLKQILFNIVGNAVKFTARGEVSLRVYGSENMSGADFVNFEITDTGIGISREQSEALFQVFTQADESMTRKFGGTGLGLALSRRLARGLGGDVVLASSTEYKGSTFLITITDLPVPQNQVHVRPRPPEKSEELGARPLEGLRLLLVEDSEDNRFLISRMITKRGGVIEVARDGAEGCTKAMSGEYDLVLMDIQMPIMDGYAATRHLRTAGYRKPIVALTAHAMDEARSRTFEAGCTDHLTKPVNPTDLVTVVLRHTRPISARTEPVQIST